MKALRAPPAQPPREPDPRRLYGPQAFTQQLGVYDTMCTLYAPFDLSNCTAESELSECLEAGQPVASINCDKVFLCRNDDYCTCTEEG